jgi:DNA-binding FrmR family transcriptional regulator
VVADAQTGRVFVEAFDRLADRLLERIRSLRQDVDADLTSVRSELASLRQAVDAVADRVQMRHLRTTLEEVHGDVVGLRRAVLEWPELEQVAEDIAAVRGDLATLATDVARLPSGPSAQVAAPGPALDDEQLERIVDAVAERVAAKLGRRR